MFIGRCVQFVRSVSHFQYRALFQSCCLAVVRSIVIPSDETARPSDASSSVATFPVVLLHRGMRTPHLNTI